MYDEMDMGVMFCIVALAFRDLEDMRDKMICFVSSHEWRLA